MADILFLRGNTAFSVLRLQGLQQRLSNEFAAEQEKYNKALHDSIANYLARYNKDKKYSIIFSKSGDNLLYADKAFCGAAIGKLTL